MSATSRANNFEQEISQNREVVSVSGESVMIETGQSSLEVRLRGGFITECELLSPSTGDTVGVLFAEGNSEKPKITATHPMVPAGPYDGVGGQHGFPRWADYHVFSLPDGPAGEKNLALQAKRSDNGLSLERQFELSESRIVLRSTIRNSRDETEETSIGEHAYFALQDENLEGLTVNGQTIDDLLGDGSEAILKDDGTLYWDFGGQAVVQFPDGHAVKISAAFEGEAKYPLGMWIWKRPGSPSVCFEPIIGVEHLDEDDTAGLSVGPYESASLTTVIELL